MKRFALASLALSFLAAGAVTAEAARRGREKSPARRPNIGLTLDARTITGDGEVTLRVTLPSACGFETTQIARELSRSGDFELASTGWAHPGPGLLEYVAVLRPMGSGDLAIGPLQLQCGDWAGTSAVAKVRVQRSGGGLQQNYTSGEPRQPAAPPPDTFLTSVARPAPGPAGPSPGMIDLFGFVVPKDQAVKGAIALGALVLSAIVVLTLSALKKTRLLAAVDEGLKADPKRAYEAYRAYRAAGGDPLALAPVTLFSVLHGSGNDAELLQAMMYDTPAFYRLEIAQLFSEADRPQEAMGLLSGRVLEKAAGNASACDKVVCIVDRASQVKEFIVQGCAGRPPEYVRGYAEAFLRQGMPDRALALLEAQGLKGTLDSTVLAKSLLAAGRAEEAFHLLNDKTKAQWSNDDYETVFRAHLALGQVDRAKEILGAVRLRKPLKSAPDIYYRFASLCDEVGDTRAALEAFEQFVSEGVTFKDAAERCAKLKGMTLHEMAAAPAGAPVVIAGKYELRALIGKGGMGEVYSGYDRALGRKVAIKKLNQELMAGSRERERFLQEARLIAQLNHPYIVGVHEILQDVGVIYLVFDFVDGRPLSSVLAQKKRLSLQECQGIFGFVCQAIDFAHKHKVFHRDLKPANIMVDKNGYVKVMDFGIASKERGSPGVVSLKEIIGTPDYMAPEQFSGEVGPASDVYALGVCLYELLNGRRPFAGPDFLAQKLGRRHAPLSGEVPGISPGIDAFMASVLEPDPAKRVPDAPAFLEGLKKV